jgi:hypothetical protein
MKDSTIHFSPTIITNERPDDGRESVPASPDVIPFDDKNNLTPSQPERRKWTRFRWELETSFHLTARGLSQVRAARIQDLSRGGSGLTLRHHLEPGTEVGIVLCHRARTYSLVIPMRVIYCQEDHDSFLAGGAFVRELDSNELHGLL